MAWNVFQSREKKRNGDGGESRMNKVSVQKGLELETGGSRVASVLRFRVPLLSGVGLCLLKRSIEGLML